MVHPRLAFFSFFDAEGRVILMGGTTCRSVGVLGRNQQCSTCLCCDRYPELGALKKKLPQKNQHHQTQTTP